MIDMTIKNQYDADKLKELISEVQFFDYITIRNNTHKSIVLPDNINCGFFITTKDANIVLPENLNCQHIDISYSTIKFLPESLKAEKSVIARFLNEITIPDNFQAGSINLTHSNISVLPKNLYVNGYLNIVSTNIKEVPEGTYIECDISYNSNIKNIGQFKNYKVLNNSVLINGYIMESDFNEPNIMRKIYNG